MPSSEEIPASGPASLKQPLPRWIENEWNDSAFADYLQKLGIYEKSEQYLAWIVRHYAQLAQKSRIPLSHLVSYIAKYAANNNAPHLQVESTARTVLLKLILGLSREKHALYNENRKVVFLYDPNSPEYYYFNFELMLEKYYAGIEEHLERSYPATDALLPPNKMPRLDIWQDLEWRSFNSSLVQNLERQEVFKILRINFPDKSHILVHPAYLSSLQETALAKFHYINNLLAAKDPRNLQELISFLAKKMPQLNLDAANYSTLIKQPVEAQPRFWTILTTSLERYLVSKPKLTTFYQAACLLHAWSLGMEQKQEQEKIREDNLQRLWDKIQSTPRLYDQSDFVEAARALQLDKVYQSELESFVNEFIRRHSQPGAVKPGQSLQPLAMGSRQKYVLISHLADIFMAQLALVKEKFHNFYVKDWQARFKNNSFKTDPLINDANEYLKDLYARLQKEENEFYHLAHDHFPLVIKAISAYPNQSRVSEWKKKHFKVGMESAFAALDILLDLRHSDLINEAEAYSPFLKMFPFFKDLVFRMRGFKAPAKKKKKPSLLKEAMVHVIQSHETAAPAKPKKVKPAAAPKPAKSASAEAKEQEEHKKAIREKLQQIQESLFGNKNIMDELDHLEKNWNRTIEQNLQRKEEIKKKNKKYVVSIIQSHIKNLKLSLQNVEGMARNIRDDRQFENIKDKEALEKYIQGYILLTLQKKHA